MRILFSGPLPNPIGEYLTDSFEPLALARNRIYTGSNIFSYHEAITVY